MIHALILDCFGVLYADPTAYFYNLALKRNAPQQASDFANLIRQVDSGMLTQQDFFQQVADVFGVPVEEVSTHLLKNVVRNTELIDYAQSLRPALKIGLLSNINRESMDVFFSPKEREDLFDDVVLSGDVHVIKPHPEIFELAAQRLDIEPHEAIFIDDNARNCEGARAVGMQSLQFSTNHELFTALQPLLASTPVDTV